MMKKNNFNKINERGDRRWRQNRVRREGKLNSLVTLIMCFFVVALFHLKKLVAVTKRFSRLALL